MVDQKIALIKATQESLQGYGLMIDGTVHRAGLSIPFYAGFVEEGDNIDFSCNGQPVMRTARIFPRGMAVTWLEYHQHLTQLFIGLGTAPYIMVLGKPSPLEPDFASVKAFWFPAGTGVVLDRGIWHDFPMAIVEPVTILTANSAEVVDALRQAVPDQDLMHGDVYKIHISRHTGVSLKVECNAR